MQKRLINDKMKEVYKTVENVLPKHCRPAFRENTFIAGSSVDDDDPLDLI